jgi:hypothetical protein
MAANNYTQCYAAASESAGRELSDNELEHFFERAQSRIGRYTREGLTPAQAAQRAGTELGDEARLARAVEARSEKINMGVQKALTARLLPEREFDSVMGTITGIEKARGDSLRKGLTGDNVGTNAYGLGDSIDSRGNAAVANALGAMERELRAAGLTKILLKGDKRFSRDFANELGRINDPTWGKATNNKFAAQAAEIVSKYLEDTRLQQNDAGAWIGKLDQYVTRQSHDADLVRGTGDPAKAYAKWRDAISPLLDEKTFLDHDAPADRESFLHQVWNNIVTGNHEGATGADWLAGFKGPSNMAAKASAERKLFFKSADSWFDYTEQFGHGDVRANVFHQIEHGARNAAIMRVAGTNPEAMIQGWIKRAADAAETRGDIDQARDIHQTAGKFSGIMDYVMRKGTGSEVPKFSNFMAAMRSIQDFKLGGPLSYISDMSTVAGVARHNGVPVAEAYWNALKGLFPSSAAEKDLASDLGAGSEGFAGSLIARMRSYDGVRGQLASLASTYEKLNGVKYWVQHEKEALGRMLSHNLGRNAEKGFADLDGRLQGTLQRYGIGAKEWEAVRAAVNPQMLDGRPYIIPNDIMSLPEDKLGGFKAKELTDKLSSFYQDQVRIGLSEPTAGINRMMLGDKRAATVQSEMFRALLQFKTFPMTHVLRSLTRELFRSNSIDGVGVAHLLAGTSILGYVAYATKKLMRGQQPAIPFHGDQNETTNAIAAGIAQGGGLGIYGDFLFGPKSRFGADTFTEALGPTYSMMADGVGTVLNDMKQAVSGTAPKKGLLHEIATQAVDFGKRNGPMMNLWYARAILDYTMLYSLQETINPGYLRRYEQQLQKDQGVNFLLHPTTDHLRTFGR